MNAVIKKWGNSQGIRLPKGLLREVGFNIDDEIEITTRDEEVILKKIKPATVKPKVTDLEALFANWEGDYKPEEIDFGEPVGREEW